MIDSSQKRESKLQLSQKAVGILLVVEGLYFLLTVLAVLFYRKIFFLEVRALLIFVGIGLYKNKTASQVLSLAYLGLSFLNGLFVAIYILFLPTSSANIVSFWGITIFEMPIWMPFFGIPIFDLPVQSVGKEIAILVIGLLACLRIWQLFITAQAFLENRKLRTKSANDVALSS